jgi:hypothetical protein
MNLSRGVTAAVCGVILTALLVVLCLSKAYISVVQRLFLYLIAATLASEVCLVATLEHQFQYRHQRSVCTALGLVTHWSTSVVILSATGVIVYTITLICLSTKCTAVSISPKTKAALETCYVIVIVILPLTVLWVPLADGNYRLAYAWCGISALNEETCEASGLVEQLVLAFGGYEVMSIAGIAAAIGLTIGYFRIGYNRAKHLLLQSIALTISVLLYLLVINARFALRLHTTANKWTQPYGLWLYHGIIVPLCQLITPFGFLGSFYLKHFQNKCCPRRSKDARKNQYNRLKEQKTFPASDRSSAPSSTFFNIPYTDAFTSVKRTDYESIHGETVASKPSVSNV